jgi:pyruvate dehydrogenase E2 component (dihydrolipoamide acetyltransferase)
MATEVIIPSLGVVVEKVTIAKWLKTEGEVVQEGEPLVEIETDKVTTEIPAPSAGILGRALYAEGDQVPVATAVAVIVQPGEGVPELYGPAAKAASAPRPEEPSPGVRPARVQPAKAVKAAPAARKLAEKEGVDLAQVTPTGPHGTIMRPDVKAFLLSGPEIAKGPRLSGVARKMAAEYGIAAEEIRGTGPGRRIKKADVLKAVEARAAEAGEEGLFGKTVQMSKMRSAIARRMSESALNVPHIYLGADLNIGPLLGLHRTIKEAFQEQFKVRLSVNDFLIKAVAMAVRQHPFLNATLRDNEIFIHREINIGLAVALDDGLIVPAIGRADRKGLGEIAQERADLVARAREGRLTVEDVEIGTFTISSLANTDVRFFTAILNPPQSGILSVGKTREELCLDQGKIKAKKVVGVGLSVDHRIVDGAMGAAFLQTLKGTLERPVYAFLDL